MKHNSLFFKSLMVAALLLEGKESLAQNHSDCSIAFAVAADDSLYFSGTSGMGKEDEASFVACFMNKGNLGQAEHNSTWLRFEIETAGSLTFVITPDYITDDYDFVVFKLPQSGDCRFKAIVRCMASSGEGDETSPCAGETGLRDGDTDKFEDGGCEDEGDDAWLAPLKVESGECYVLLVSNVTAPYQGFTIRFNGDCKFKN